MLKHNEANPLAVFGLRELDHCPPHFTKIEFQIKCTPKSITDWVWEHLEGRFWFGDLYYKDPSNSVHTQKCIAFEIPGEASMFALILDQLNKFDYDW
jgi:hypothetical protein